MTASQRIKELASGCGSCRFSASGLCADHERYADAVREAEAAAAARQREADAEICRAVLESWDRGSPALGAYEAGAVTAAEMCVERIMGGGSAAGGGGAGGEK
jgi:hypothetical protein